MHLLQVSAKHTLNVRKVAFTGARSCCRGGGRNGGMVVGSTGIGCAASHE